MIENERDIRQASALDGARQMMVAARTAPKGKGIDVIEAAIVDGGDLEELAQKMLAIGAKRDLPFFTRDAGCVRAAQCVVLVGTHERAQNLDCRRCGYDTCGSRAAGVPCAINCVDVGIALGSACSRAADLRLDTRVMFSAGMAAEKLDILKGCRQVYAIAVSISSKSPFFDR